MKSFWKGSFLRKHVVNVEFVLAQDASEDVKNRAEDIEGEIYGYYVVTFDHGESGHTPHVGGTYVYPATFRDYESMGERPEGPSFYRW